MKVIGLIGGMSWESSLQYYRMINEAVKKKLGGLHSAECVMYSVDFATIESLQHKGDWKKAAQILARASQNLEQAGAEFLILCTNTMHKVLPDIETEVNVPFIHIADATATRIKAHSMKCVGLIGTRFTMAEDFYKGRLSEKYGLEVIVPPLHDQQLIDSVIYDELCLGLVNDRSKKEYIRILKQLGQHGAKGIILGCTEVGLLLTQSDVDIALFDTTQIHAEAAVEFAMTVSASRWG